jgi:hypothetical protein
MSNIEAIRPQPGRELNRTTLFLGFQSLKGKYSE